VPLVLTFFGEYYKIGLAIPMLAGTVVGATGIIISLLMSPESRGRSS
jgi:VIT1/CCC1 family predicted Fe2+/Mn2+ transporter